MILDYQDLDEHYFDSIADIILNRRLLIVKNKKFRLTEIEMYLRNNNHNDEYVHCIDDQLNYKTFYFHKFKTGTYKSGTFKGMDLTFGDKDTNTYFGILIRSIKDCETNEIIEGPCNCVNRILKEYGMDSISQFTENKTLNILKNKHNFIVKREIFDKEDIYKGPRIGLGDKYPEFKLRPYRYVIFKNSIKKQRKTLNILVE